jgi:hypothetical protein
MFFSNFLQLPPSSSNSSLMELNFFSILYSVSKRMTIFLSVPETFIYGYGFEKPTLICTDKKNNELCFESNLSSAGIHEGFVFFKEIALENMPIAVLKTQNRMHDKCEALMTVKECQQIWDSSVKTNKNVCIQRYIYSGKFPKVIKVEYSIDDPISKALLIRKTGNIHTKLQNAQSGLPGLHKVSTVKALEKRWSLIKKKEVCEIKEIGTDYALQSQVINLLQCVEKYYSSNKNCKVDSMVCCWTFDKNENYYFINMKSFKLLNIVYKPIQLGKVKHTKSSSMNDAQNFRILARIHKQEDSKLRFKSANKLMRSVPKVRFLDASVNLK